MKKVACVFALLALASFASANVEIFFTSASPWNTSWGGPPANIFAPSAGNGTDYENQDADGNPIIGDGYAVATSAFPTAFNSNLNVNPGDTAYIWIKFNYDAVNGPSKLAKMQGLDLMFQNTATGNYDIAAHGGDIAFYMSDNSVAGAAFGPRWDGDIGNPPYSNFKKSHQVLVAVTAKGIPFNTSQDPLNMYRWNSTGQYGIALLGAVKVGHAGDFEQTGIYDFALGTQGINFNTGVNVSPPVSFGTLTVIPEPAAILLLGLAGLLIRRR